MSVYLPMEIYDHKFANWKSKKGEVLDCYYRINYEETFLKYLNTVKDNGDAVFVLDFWSKYDGKTMLRVPLKASGVLNSLEGDKVDCLYEG